MWCSKYEVVQNVKGCSKCEVVQNVRFKMWGCLDCEVVKNVRLFRIWEVQMWGCSECDVQNVRLFNVWGSTECERFSKMWSIIENIGLFKMWGVAQSVTLFSMWEIINTVQNVRLFKMWVVQNVMFKNIPKLTSQRNYKPLPCRIRDRALSIFCPNLSQCCDIGKSFAIPSLSCWGRPLLDEKAKQARPRPAKAITRHLWTLSDAQQECKCRFIKNIHVSRFKRKRREFYAGFRELQHCYM